MAKILKKKSDTLSKREVADPLAQFAAARMMGQGLAGLGFTGKGRSGVPRSMINGYLGQPFDMLVRRFQREGLAKQQAVAAALRIIYAQNLAGKKL